MGLGVASVSPGLPTSLSPVPDVLDMVDVLVEGSEGLDEEIGFSLTEDMVQQTFPFSAMVPAALEARNKLILGPENETGTEVLVERGGSGVQEAQSSHCIRHGCTWQLGALQGYWGQWLAGWAWQGVHTPGSVFGSFLALSSGFTPGSLWAHS